MKQKPKFEVEDIFNITDQGMAVMVKKINEIEFQLTHRTKLDNAPIKQGDIPRKLDDKGNCRTDVWVFILKNEKDSSSFAVGQVVELNQI